MTSFICNNSFTYVLRIIILDVSETAREKTRDNNNGLSHVPSKRKEEIKSGTSGCGSFVVAYFQPATSIDRLQMYFNSCVNLIILFLFVLGPRIFSIFVSIFLLLSFSF